ncbi:hypothetical protein GCK72_021998 [Caenorhabditis remanei]|uniref:G-protein coupled receptors family 1 profile domain-containing protein n=1 Tax=Caenorhabditis remanei TaxID=31234 RepID=A0A6A5GM80_CAERE|nr:hypothetical protein GCK72_021998 [Caenorhabditis remanei]KAF1755429.1 hypothetical protein GCK72_021998 [Caenorhabditis remanei]
MDYFDETYPEDIRDFLNSLLKKALGWARVASTVQIITSCIGCFLNVFHVFILFRKELRSQATNILIIGIAVSDFVYLLYYVDGATWDWLKSGVPQECIPPDSLIHQIWTWVLFIFKDALRRVSSWLAVGLILQLMKARDGRRILMRKDEEHEMLHITRLIICMTIAYFLAETPVGISYFCLSVLIGDEHGYGLQFLVNYITIILNTFLVIHSSIHCFFCFFLSSEYRKTIGSLFGCTTGRNGVGSSRNLSTSS